MNADEDGFSRFVACRLFVSGCEGILPSVIGNSDVACRRKWGYQDSQPNFGRLFFVFYVRLLGFFRRVVDGGEAFFWEAARDTVLSFKF